MDTLQLDTRIPEPETPEAQAPDTPPTDPQPEAPPAAETQAAGAPEAEKQTDGLPAAEAQISEMTAAQLQEAPQPVPLPQPPEAGAFPRGRKLRPEIIMGLVAGAAAVMLAVVLALCLPHFGAQDPALSQDPVVNEDPEALPEYHQQAQEPEETYIESTQPENPTIPPDPNPYGRYDFQYNANNYLLLQNVTSYPGVDVSAHQGSIDWNAVKASGIDFAIIRLGYRGYGSGKLVEDDYARQNLTGAAQAGLRVGAYFFSQALNITEANEEINFMLNILGQQKLDMPIILDWEVPADDARTAGKMDARTLTDIQLHFCSVMEQKGYTPMVYFNWHQSENLYYLSELESYPFWLALYQDRMTYPWKVDMWQYSDSGSVPGISGPVDLNVYMPY